MRLLCWLMFEHRDVFICNVLSPGREARVSGLWQCKRCKRLTLGIPG